MQDENTQEHTKTTSMQQKHLPSKQQPTMQNIAARKLTKQLQRQQTKYYSAKSRTSCNAKQQNTHQHQE